MFFGGVSIHHSEHNICLNTTFVLSKTMHKKIQAGQQSEAEFDAIHAAQQAKHAAMCYGGSLMKGLRKKWPEAIKLAEHACTLEPTVEKYRERLEQLEKHR